MAGAEMVEEVRGAEQEAARVADLAVVQASVVVEKAEVTAGAVTAEARVVVVLEVVEAEVVTVEEMLAVATVAVVTAVLVVEEKVSVAAETTAVVGAAPRLVGTAMVRAGERGADSEAGGGCRTTTWST